VTTDVIALYMVDGLTPEQIAVRLGVSESYVRGQLCGVGIRLRRVGSVTQPSEPVSAAAKRLGFRSFHDFVVSQGVATLQTQARTLGVSERSFVRLYERYTHLLEQLRWAGRRVTQQPRAASAG